MQKSFAWRTFSTWYWIIPSPGYKYCHRTLGKKETLLGVRFVLKHFLHVNVLVWQQRAALRRIVNNDWKLSTSFLQRAVSRLACLPVYGMPPSQIGIVLLLLYTMWVVKPENELPLYQQHLVLVHFLGLLLMREVCVYQSEQSTAKESEMCLQKSRFNLSKCLLFLFFM